MRVRVKGEGEVEGEGEGEGEGELRLPVRRCSNVAQLACWLPTIGDRLNKNRAKATRCTHGVTWRLTEARSFTSHLYCALELEKLPAGHDRLQLTPEWQVGL